MNKSVMQPAKKEKSRFEKRPRNAPLAQITDETSISIVFFSDLNYFRVF